MKAQVRMNGRVAGILERDGDTVRFQYDKTYLKLRQPPLSLSMPLREEPFEYKGLPPYFSGWVSEGWLTRVQLWPWNCWSLAGKVRKAAPAIIEASLMPEELKARYQALILDRLRFIMQLAPETFASGGCRYYPLANGLNRPKIRMINCLLKYPSP